MVREKIRAASKKRELVGKNCEKRYRRESNSAAVGAKKGKRRVEKWWGLAWDKGMNTTFCNHSHNDVLGGARKEDKTRFQISSSRKEDR